MKSKKSLRLVIDADVARAAGLSNHPTSSASREVLTDILEVCHRVVFTAEIKAEWEKHKSRFFTTWRRSMVARRKQVVVRTATTETVMEKVETAPIGARARQRMTKDAHLVAAAVATDRAIVSLDDKARKSFEALAVSCGELEVKWLNPLNSRERSFLIHGDSL